MRCFDDDGVGMKAGDTAPCPFPDPGEACQAWRQNRLHELQTQLHHLGLSDDPETMKLLKTLVEEDAKVQDLWEQQRDGSVQTPWWADGEYDGKAADLYADTQFR